MKTLIAITCTGLAFGQSPPDNSAIHKMKDGSEVVKVEITKQEMSPKDNSIKCEAQIKNISSDVISLKCYSDPKNKKQLALEQNQDFIAYFREEKDDKSRFTQIIAAPGSYDAYNSVLTLKPGQSGTVNIDFSSPPLPGGKIFRCDFFFSVGESPVKLKVTTKEFRLRKD